MIKRIELLGLTAADQNKVIKRAELHYRYSSIIFSLNKDRRGKIFMEIKQEKSHAENYFDATRLREIGKELFNDIDLEVKIFYSSKVYQESVTDIVTPAWISSMMSELSIKGKEVAADLGIDKSVLSAAVNNHRNLSNVSKAMYYYYFMYKQSQNK